MARNLDGLLANPMFMAGLGLLGTNQWSGAATGLLAAQQGRQALAQSQREQQLYDLKMQEFQAKQQAEADKKAALAKLAESNPLAGQLAAAGITPPSGMFTPPKPQVLGAGGMLVAPDGKVLAQAPFKPDTLSPEAFAQKQTIAQAGRPLTSFSTPYESKYDQEQGKYYAGRYAEIQDAARQSGKIAQNASLSDKLLADVYTGTGATQIQAAKKLARLFGYQFPETGGADAALSIANQAAMELRNPAGGAGMPGAMSDADRVFLTQSTGLSLETTPEGRKLMLEINKRLAKRNQEIAAEARRYNGGRLDAGFDELIAKKYGGTDLFGDLMQSVNPGPGNLSDDELLRQLNGQ